jgi:hypothetical protein
MTNDGFTTCRWFDIAALQRAHAGVVAPAR